MKKWFTNNIGIKILSIAFAFVLWLIIINIDDPVKSRTFTVGVDVLNEDAIVAVNKVYEIVEGSTAQVTVSGHRSVIDGLKEADIGATADLSALSNVNAVAIKPYLKKAVSSESEVELVCKQVLKVSLEDLETIQVKVTVETQGTPQDGYVVGESVAKPNMIEVSGGKSAIEKIDTAKVFMDVDNVDDDLSERLIPHVYDAAGNEIASSSMSFSQKRVKATVRILAKKSVPVRLKVQGRPADGYIFTEAYCLPEKVELAGNKSVLDKIKEIIVPVNISGLTSASQSLERDVETINYLPDGVKPEQITVVDTFETISIQINLEPATQRMINLPTSDIQILNLDENLQIGYELNTTAYTVMVSGTEEAMGKIVGSDLHASIDCKGLKAGKHKLRVHFSTNDGVTVNQKLFVKVRLYKQRHTSSGEEGEENPSPQPSVQPGATPKESEGPEQTPEAQEVFANGADDEKSEE